MASNIFGGGTTDLSSTDELLLTSSTFLQGISSTTDGLLVLDGEVSIIPQANLPNGTTTVNEAVGYLADTLATVSGALDAAGVKNLYESNANTNAYTDADKTAVVNIPTTISTALTPYRTATDQDDIDDTKYDVSNPAGYQTASDITTTLDDYLTKDEASNTYETIDIVAINYLRISDYNDNMINNYRTKFQQDLAESKLSLTRFTNTVGVSTDFLITGYKSAAGNFWGINEDLITLTGPNWDGVYATSTSVPQPPVSLNGLNFIAFPGSTDNTNTAAYDQNGVIVNQFDNSAVFGSYDYSMYRFIANANNTQLCFYSNYDTINGRTMIGLINDPNQQVATPTFATDTVAANMKIFDACFVPNQGYYFATSQGILNGYEAGTPGASPFTWEDLRFSGSTYISIAFLPITNRFIVQSTTKLQYYLNDGIDTPHDSNISGIPNNTNNNQYFRPSIVSNSDESLILAHGNDSNVIYISTDQGLTYTSQTLTSFARIYNIKYDPATLKFIISGYTPTNVVIGFYTLLGGYTEGTLANTTVDIEPNSGNYLTSGVSRYASESDEIIIDKNTPIAVANGEDAIKEINESLGEIKASKLSSSVASITYKTITEFNSDIADYSTTAETGQLITDSQTAQNGQLASIYLSQANAALTYSTLVQYGYILRPGVKIVSTIGVASPQLGQAYDTPNNALAAMVAGETMIIFPGTYTLTTAITPVAGVSIYGVDKNTCILQMLPTTASAGIIFISAANISINNLTFKVISSTDGINLGVLAITNGNDTFRSDNTDYILDHNTSAGTCNDLTINTSLNAVHTSDALFNFTSCRFINKSNGNGLKRCVNIIGAVANADIHFEGCYFDCSRYSTGTDFSAIGIASGTTPECRLMNCYVKCGDGTYGNDIIQTVGNIRLGKSTFLENFTSNGIAPVLLNSDTYIGPFCNDGALPATTSWAYPTGVWNGNARSFAVHRKCIVYGLQYTNRVNSASDSTVITLVKNGVDTALTATIPAGSLIGTGNNAAVVFNAGDVYSIKIVRGTGTLTDTNISFYMY